MAIICIGPEGLGIEFGADCFSNPLAHVVLDGAIKEIGEECETSEIDQAIRRIEAVVESTIHFPWQPVMSEGFQCTRCDLENGLRNLRRLIGVTSACDPSLGCASKVVVGSSPTPTPNSYTHARCVKTSSP